MLSVQDGKQIIGPSCGAGERCVDFGVFCRVICIGNPSNESSSLSFIFTQLLLCYTATNNRICFVIHRLLKMKEHMLIFQLFGFKRFKL